MRHYDCLHLRSSERAARMRLPIHFKNCLLAALFASSSALADTCLVRPTDSQNGSAAYSAIESWSRQDMQLLLDEFAFKRAWHKHSEAIAEAFGRGDQVYG